jgi:hypothetical protein
MFEAEKDQNMSSQWAAKKIVQNLPGGIRLFEMKCSVEFRNEGYISAAYAGLMTT